MPTFSELGIRPEILAAITELGFETPTPVQEKAIPHLLSSEQDVVALAQTGTGKTAAFGLPLLHAIDPELRQVQALVLAPTRELCVQITRDLGNFSKNLPGVRRVPLMLRTELPTLLPTENVSSTPIAVWRLGDYWVTAVKLRNRGSKTVQLDPRRLQAKLFAAAFQHAFLGPVGSAEDTTIAYLVTRGAGLEQAVLLAPVARGADDES